MFNNRTLAILKRELREKLFSKSFIIMTLLIPIFMFGTLGLQTFLMSYGGDSDSIISVISEDAEITNGLQAELTNQKPKDFFVADFKTLSKDEFKKYLEDEKQKLIEDKITGIVYVPKSAIEDKKIEYYSKNPNNQQMFSKLKDGINKSLVANYFREKEITSKDISFASSSVDFSGFRISKDNISEEGYGNLILSFLFTFLLYFSLLFIGTIMMRSVVQEKNNRIVEVLLSSVNSQELMTGKILGVSITGLVQMAIWLSPLIVLISTSIFMLPAEFVLNLEMWHIVYFLFNYLIGLVTFMGLFAAVGAMFDNEQDSQSGQWPVMMLIMIPFFIAISMQGNPENTIAKIASLFPFASLMVMPARITLVDVPVWEFLLSIGLSILTMIFVFWLSGKIYKVGILSTGKKPKFSEIVQWVRS